MLPSARSRCLRKCWYCWQVARSLAPLFFRSWERASVTRASTAIVAAAVAATVPATALLTLRSFALSQVPLKTTAELSAVFAVTLLVVAWSPACRSGGRDPRPAPETVSGPHVGAP